MAAIEACFDTTVERRCPVRRFLTYGTEAGVSVVARIVSVRSGWAHPVVAQRMTLTQPSPSERESE
jgi:hypothetical protein